VPQAWCLGDGSAYLSEECLDAYAELLDVAKEDTITLAAIFADVHWQCGNNAHRVRHCPLPYATPNLSCFVAVIALRSKARFCCLRMLSVPLQRMA
jgi:hypothetical protein